ncbi:hypothetical protein FOZ63_005845 [Perkinsus olseni]|uniref:Uncharacterized protein n=1 Tax=Perkinsus olseni TaxID=32597 RepID=A0A7J6Q8B2_PEROL|nr:hypothetical protein FOZ63_005845 [Perkinsus olseni]KAF4726663.1 hypothetical protein FOZ62_001616 [Perkinsus olseni]
MPSPRKIGGGPSASSDMSDGKRCRRGYAEVIWDNITFSVEVICDWCGIMPGTERNSDYEDLIAEGKLKRKIEKAIERYPSEFGVADDRSSSRE